MPKILITGGAGFIGSTVADFFLENDFEVVVVDNLSTGNFKNVPQKAKFYRADILDEKAIFEIFQTEKPDVLCHHAAQINVRLSLENPKKDAEINILGGLNLLKIAEKFGVKKIIFASTGGAIYGETDDLPTPENHFPDPKSPYGIAKFCFEKYLEISKIPATILRYGNVFGPRQNARGEAGVVAIFCEKMIRGENPKINGDGAQTRDFVFVDDVARANIAAAKNPEISGIFNVGTGIEKSVNDVFFEIQKHFPQKFSPEKSPKISGEIQKSCLDFQKIKRAFGWSPKVNFADGIAKTVEFFSQKNDFCRRTGV